MKTYLEALDLWEVVEEDFDVTPLPNNNHDLDQKPQRKKNQSLSYNNQLYYTRL